MQDSSYLRVVPDAITFRDLKQGESDTVEVWATNIGRSPIGIRFSIPPGSPFDLIQTQSVITPPGLEAKASIKYTAKDLQAYSSELTISCSKSRITIPITVSPPCPRITSDVQNLKLGTIGVNLPYKFAISLTNIGVKEGPFSLKSEFDSIEFLPQNGVILPSKYQEISVTVKPQQAGDFNFQIDVDFNGESEPIQPIKVSGTAVPHSLALYINDKEVKELDFGTIFYGQKRIITATIVNNGPAKRSFVVLGSREDAAATGSTTSNEEDPIDQIFSVMPSEGMLEPHGKMNVNFSFAPPSPKTPIIDDIDQLFTAYNTIEVVETAQHIEIQLSGKGVHSFVQLSSYDFMFEKCERNVKQERELKITNNSRFLPLSYKVNPIAQYRFKPPSGTIDPHSSKVVKIIFFPKNYGEFNLTTIVNLGEGLIKKVINLNAVCGQITDHPFRRVPQYETNEIANYNAYHPDTRFSDGIEGLRRTKKLRETFDGYITDYARKREVKTAMQQSRTKLRNQAISYLQSTQGTYTQEDIDEYLQTQKRAQTAMNSIGLDMDPYEDLSPPDPKIRNTPLPSEFNDPLKSIYDTQNTDAASAIMRAKKVQMDDNVLIKKKFKSKPTTPAEINECSRPLTPAQQLMVVASHQNMNFGQVSVHSNIAKSFTITNNLQQHILVTINYEHEELSKSTPSSQIVLPKQTAGFDIRFSSPNQQNFSKTIQYSINHHHTYSLNITAKVVPIDLQLSRNLIEFRFSPDSITPFIKEFVIIQNKSNAEASYMWTGMSSVFSLSQSSGTIEHLKSHNIEITYTPTTNAHDETTLLLNVTGGSSRSLKCIGDIGVPKCSLNKKFVNFGLIPIGIQKTQSIKIKNTGDDDAIYTISYTNVNELQVIPQNGRIAAHESQTFQLNFKSLHASPFDIPVVVSIAGSNPLSFNVMGQSELPSVQLLNSEFEFGRLFVGSSSSIEGCIQNTGNIPAILFLDLSNHPDFRIEFSTELANESGGENKNSIALVSNPVFVTKSEQQGLMSRAGSQVSFAETATDETTVDDAANGPGLVYKFYLVEGTQIKFNLVFQPTEPMEHSFELPFTMMNVISASSFHLQPIVSAESIKAPLTIATPSIDFGVASTFNPQNPHCRPIVRQINFNNEVNQNLPWRIDTDKIKKDNPVFTIEPSSGIMIPNQTATIHVSFMAREAQPYIVRIPVFVKTDKDKEESIVGEIQLSGVGTLKLFSLSQNNVVLPVVPLGVKSQQTINLINDAFIESTLKVEYSASESNFPVKINFPEGNQIQHTQLSIPIVVTFQSNKPMSFSTMIAIVDNNGNAATFSVYCTTDNSLFTLYPFFRGNEVNIKSSKGSPISVDTKVCTKVSDLCGRFISSTDILKLLDPNEKWESAMDKKMVNFMQRYMNALLLGTQLSDFPNDFLRNDCQLILELIFNISGGRRPNVDNSDKEKPKDSMQKHLDQIKRILHFVQSMGCLISNVRPEFLLPRTEFLSFMRNKFTKQLLGIDYFNAPDISSFDQNVIAEFTASKSFSNSIMQHMKAAEQLYMELTKESLMIILLQLFKIFVLGKIDVERLNQSPGVADATKSISNIAARFTKMEDVVSEICRPNKNCQSSPVFSTAECVLLKWVSIHTCNQYNDLLKSVNSFNSLNNSIAYLALLKAHTTILKMPLPEVVQDNQMMNEYAINFTSSLKELKLAFCPTADEISGGSPQMLAIITAYLFETLPRYISTTTIEYQTTIHKTITKSINIQNPSKAEITYRAKLEGSHNYTMQNDSITIAPGQNCDFNVTFSARTMKPQAGRLILSPQRPRVLQNDSTESSAATSRLSQEARMPSFSAPIVVDLISDVTITSPDFSQTFEGQIYQNTPIALPVKNYIGCRSRVKIFSRVFMIADENGKPLPAMRQISQQINDMINDPNAVIDDDLNSAKSTAKTDKSNQFNSLLKQHQIFSFNQTEIDFPMENSKAQLDLEFIPIALGTYRCILLFQDNNNGEFVIEVIGKALLPQPVEACQNKFKCEANKKVSYNLSIDTMNVGLIRALAYSSEKSQSSSLYCSERKFKELVQRRQHEYESVYKQWFSSNVFTVVNSATQYFDIANEVTVNKTNFGESTKGNHPNVLPITFKPVKAGQYPLHLVLNSKYDIRCFVINAVGLAATKELSIEFATVAGRSVKQDVPFTNPSDETWNFKFVIMGDSSFNVPQRLSVKPNQTGIISINFNPGKIGQYAAELQATNTTKESTVIYKLTGNVEEPPAERKISISCQARQRYTEKVDIKPFIRNGNLHVTTTVPIITFNSDILMENGSPKEPWTFTVLAPRSGVSAGTLTFTDPISGNYIWYIVEIQVSSPSPEQTIKVTTLARKTETIKIPIQNTKKVEAYFSVVLSDDDLFGDTEFKVPPQSTANYELIVSPLKAMARNSSVYFYSDDDGEFWYAIKIIATDSPTESIAPLTSPIGKHASTYILLENPLSKSTSFRYENSNPTAFHVMAKRLINLLPLEKKRIEVRYIPTTLGVKETTEISFHGTESGDYTYTLSGTGKPPQPLSPIIVNGAMNQPSSALVLFTNPFPYPARFQMSLASENEGEIFKFLLKKKNFQLSSFGEEFQIPFTFNPSQLGQFSAHIIVAYTGPARGQIQEGELPTIRWIFSVIGNSVSVNNTELKHMKCRAMEIENAEMTFTLVGETEMFEASEYSLTLNLPPESDFLRFNVDMKPNEVHKNASCTELIVGIKFSPQRPVTARGRIIIKNPLAQEWSFDIQFTAERGKPTATISIEAPINKTGTANVVIPAAFRAQTPFHSYMVQGSACEFTLTADHGYIEAGVGDHTDMPFQIIFAPKMYGKVLQGLLVVDTIDSQYIFEVVGKTPEYVPPVIKSGSRLGEIKPEEEEAIRAKTALRAKKKPNYIRENIEAAKHAKIVSPHTPNLKLSFK